MKSYEFDTGPSGLAASLDTESHNFSCYLLQGSNTMEQTVVLLRRELTRAQARLRRCERERDALRNALEALKAGNRDRKKRVISRVSKK
jgi:hypothetical protein